MTACTRLKLRAEDAGDLAEISARLEHAEILIEADRLACLFQGLEEPRLASVQGREAPI